MTITLTPESTQKLAATAKQISTTLADWQVAYLDNMAKGFESLKSEVEGFTMDTTPLIQVQPQYELKSLTWVDEWTDQHPYTQLADARPRAVTREEAIASLEKIVAAVGTNYVATSHSTNSTGIDGRRCVQGELMVDLGWTNEMLPGAHDGVSALLVVQNDPVFYGVLECAEHMNDMGKPWGEILDMAKRAFATAA